MQPRPYKTGMDNDGNILFYMHRTCTGPVFVNVYGAQEPPGWESIPGLLKRSTNTGTVQAQSGDGRRC
jgi:hypothetical protein